MAFIEKITIVHDMWFEFLTKENNFSRRPTGYVLDLTNELAEEVENGNHDREIIANYDKVKKYMHSIKKTARSSMKLRNLIEIIDNRIEFMLKQYQKTKNGIFYNNFEKMMIEVKDGYCFEGLEKMQSELELGDIQYNKDNIKKLISKYENTPGGHIYIDYLIHEIKKTLN